MFDWTVQIRYFLTIHVCDLLVVLFAKVQLTDQHRILNGNIADLATALGGRRDTVSGELVWEEDTPYDLLDETKTILQSDINTTRNELDVAKTALETKIDANKAALDDLQSQIDALKASLQTSAAADGGDATGRRTRQLQSDGTDEETNLGPAIGSSLGLTVEVRCPPPMKGSSKSTKGMESLTIDLYVNTQTYGKDCNATVSNVTAMYVNKEGSYKNQVGRIESSIHMGEGVQIVSIHLDKDKDEIYEHKDVTLLHITAVKEKGVHQKSVTFDYSDCQA